MSEYEYPAFPDNEDDTVPGPLDPPEPVPTPVSRPRKDEPEPDDPGPPLTAYIIQFANLVNGELMGEKTLVGNNYSVMGDLFLVYHVEGGRARLAGTVRGFTTVETMPVFAGPLEVQ